MIVTALFVVFFTVKIQQEMTESNIYNVIIGHKRDVLKMNLHYLLLAAGCKLTIKCHLVTHIHVVTLSLKKIIIKYDYNNNINAQ